MKENREFPHCDSDWESCPVCQADPDRSKVKSWHDKAVLNKRQAMSLTGWRSADLNEVMGYFQAGVGAGYIIWTADLYRLVLEERTGQDLSDLGKEEIRAIMDANEEKHRELCEREGEPS